MSSQRTPWGAVPTRWRVELLAGVAYVLIFFAWYPSTFAIIDESTYLSTAYVYRAGTIFNDVAGVDNVSRVHAGTHDVSKFAPLWPALLSPFTLAGWRATFTANLVLHLVGFALFARLARRAGMPSWVSLLYLAHPTLVFYSRTLMSDVAAGVLFLAAWWHFTAEQGKRSALLAGVWAGLSCAVRYTNALLVALLVVASVVGDRRRHRARPARTGALILGLVPCALALALYNQIAFGTWWRGTAGYRGEQLGPGMGGQFSTTVFLGGVHHYGAALLLVYPLMLLPLFLYRGRDRFALVLLALGYTVFFCFYYYRDRSGGFLQTAVVGLRFLIPVLPLYLFAYADVLARAFRDLRVSARAATVGLAVPLLLTTVGLSARHEAYLGRVDADRRTLYALTADGSTILCDTAARKLVHEVWGHRSPIRVEFRGRWEIPPGVAPADNVFVAMAGRGAFDPPPAPLASFLSEARAIPVATAMSGSRVRVWRLPNDRS